MQSIATELLDKELDGEIGQFKTAALSLDATPPE